MQHFAYALQQMLRAQRLDGWPLLASFRRARLHLNALLCDLQMAMVWHHLRPRRNQFYLSRAAVRRASRRRSFARQNPDLRLLREPPGLGSRAAVRQLLFVRQYEKLLDYVRRSFAG